MLFLQCCLWRTILEKLMIHLSTQKRFFCSMLLFLSTWNTFSCNTNFFLVDIKQFFVEQLIFVASDYFSCNIKLLFWTLFRILCHRGVFLLSRSNKNIIMFHFIFAWYKKIISCFIASQIFYIQFLHLTFAACWSSSWWSRNKGTFKQSFAYLSDMLK